MLKRSGVLRDASLLIGGTAGGHLVVLAVSPIISRLFLPEEIGLLGSFNAGLAVLSVVATLGYEAAVVGADDEQQAQDVLSIILTLTLAFAACGLIVSFLLLLFGASGLYGLLGVAISLSIVPANIFTALQQFYLRQQAFKRLAVASFSSLGGRGFAQVAAGLMQGGLVGLIAGDAIARAVGAWAADVQGATRAALHAVPARRRHLWQLAVAKKNFALFQMPASLLDTVLSWFPLPVVAWIWGLEAAGQFALIHRISTAPASLIGANLANLYHQRAVGYLVNNPRRLLHVTALLIIAILLVLAPVWLVLFIWGGELFTFVFGEQWAVAGLISHAFVPVVGFRVAEQMFARLFMLVGFQRARFNIMLLLVSFGAVGLIGAGLGGLSYGSSINVLVAIQTLPYALMCMIGLKELRTRSMPRQS